MKRLFASHPITIIYVLTIAASISILEIVKVALKVAA